MVSLCLHGAVVLMPGSYLNPAPPERQPKGEMFVEVPLEETWDWQDEAIADMALNDLPETEIFRPLQDTVADINIPSRIDHAVFPVPEFDIPQEESSPEEVSTRNLLEEILKDEPQPVDVQDAQLRPEPIPAPPEIVGLKDGRVLDLENPLEVPYPTMARRRGQQGAVVVQIEVSADGHVQHVRVSESSGYPLLDSAVLRAVKRHRYQPLIQNGQALAAKFDYKVQFELK